MAAKRKRMTQREKTERAEFKRHMQEKGILPPDKPRLNRRKYIDETIEMWNGRPEFYLWEVYLMNGFSIMLGKTEGMEGRVSKEAVGAAKAIRIALRLYEFHMKLKEEGRDSYTVGEQYEFLKDILDA